MSDISISGNQVTAPGLLLNGGEVKSHEVQDGLLILKIAANGIKDDVKSSANFSIAQNLGDACSGLGIENLTIPSAFCGELTLPQDRGLSNTSSPQFGTSEGSRGGDLVKDRSLSESYASPFDNGENGALSGREALLLSNAIKEQTVNLSEDTGKNGFNEKIEKLLSIQNISKPDHVLIKHTDVADYFNKLLLPFLSGKSTETGADKSVSYEDVNTSSEITDSRGKPFDTSRPAILMSNDPRCLKMFCRSEGRTEKNESVPYEILEITNIPGDLQEKLFENYGEFLSSELKPGEFLCLYGKGGYSKGNIMYNKDNNNFSRKTLYYKTSIANDKTSSEYDANKSSGIVAGDRELSSVDANGVQDPKTILFSNDKRSQTPSWIMAALTAAMTLLSATIGGVVTEIGDENADNADGRLAEAEGVVTAADADVTVAEQGVNDASNGDYKAVGDAAASIAMQDQIDADRTAYNVAQGAGDTATMDEIASRYGVQTNGSPDFSADSLTASGSEFMEPIRTEAANTAIEDARSTAIAGAEKQLETAGERQAIAKKSVETARADKAAAESLKSKGIAIITGGALSSLVVGGIATGLYGRHISVKNKAGAWNKSLLENNPATSHSELYDVEKSGIRGVRKFA